MPSKSEVKKMIGNAAKRDEKADMSKMKKKAKMKKMK